MRTLYSIRPKWVGKILNKEKKWEIRKDCPSRLKPPFTALIYCTQGKLYLYRVDDDDNFELTSILRPKTYEYVKDYNELNGKVVGEFTCDKIEKIVFTDNRYLIAGKDEAYTNKVANESCLDFDDLANYLRDYAFGYALHISDLKIYDEPKELREFSKVCPCYDDCQNCKHKSENCKEWREIKRPLQSWGYIR